jgi:pre-mRNA-splicing helicase BRR2
MSLYHFNPLSNLQLENTMQREQQLSDHLSELIENTLEDLTTSKCISIDEDEVSPLNLGMIASYYYINYVTMELFSMSLAAKTKLRGLLEIISASTEFEDVPIRHHEDGILQKIYDRVAVKFNVTKFNDPHVKTNILLQAHFSRIQLPADLEADQKMILERVIRLIQASVDVISSNGWLAPALAAMEMSQMTVQGVWDRDSPLRQIPHMNSDLIDELKKSKVESVFDLMEMEDGERDRILAFDQAKMADVARFANRYPNIEVNHELESETVEQGGSTVLRVLLERDMDEDEELGPVNAPFYPKQKDEGWYVVIGDPKEKTLLAIKRSTLQKKAAVKLEFSPPDGAPVGKMKLKLYVMCDAYVGVDQEYDITIDVVEGTEDSEESGSE